MPQPITIGGIEFPSKTDAENHIRVILMRYSQMEALRGDDLNFVAAVLDKHPNYDVIVGPGVKRIVVQHLNDRYKSRRFMLIRTDSSVRDFTWRSALYPKNARSHVLKACRWAVRDQIVAFKDKHFREHPDEACALSGKPITRLDSDVDHIPPRTFVAIVDAWLRCNHLAAEDIGLVPMGAYERPDRWEDPFLEENWRQYHQLHAQLRVIHPWANRSLVRKGQENGE